MSRTLNELEASKLLSRHGIPMTESMLCRDRAQLPEIAGSLGFPVVMKILSADILHKTEAGCVRLSIRSLADMETAYDEILANAAKNAPAARIEGVIIQRMQAEGLQVIFGVNRDSQFGPVVVFGIGGIYVELLKAVSMRLLPITRADALEMIEETPLAMIFQGARGKRYDREEVVAVLLGLSGLLGEHPEIREIDINPFILYEQNGAKSCGVDAIVVMDESNVPLSFST